MLTLTRFGWGPLILALAPSLVYGNSSPTYQQVGSTNNYGVICESISSAISTKSAVFYPGSKQYRKDVHHFSRCNMQAAACTVEPGSTKDVGTILQILGTTRTPFSVKGGGHTFNPGFSSSPGIQIAMYRFNQVKYNTTSRTVVFGTGLTFDDVYAALAPHNVSIAGGRVSGVGVGGFMLGGGYSWKTNQNGLGFETIVAYELVRPDGEVIKVTAESDAELFFGLKGGFNNFGIVTRFTMKVLPQPVVWGGQIVFPVSSVPDVTAAIVKFSATNRDPKANIIPSYTFVNGQPMIQHLFYYDGPSPPKGLFDDSLKIARVSQDVHERSLSDLVESSNLDFFNGLRSICHTVPLAENSPGILKAVLNETRFWGADLASKSGSVIYLIEPFLPTIFSYNSQPTAYPPTRGKVYFPTNICFVWTDSALDGYCFTAVKDSAGRIRDVAIGEGQDIVNAPLYPNYAMFGTKLEDMYGEENVRRLKRLKRRVDPLDVMGLAGGFKV